MTRVDPSQAGAYSCSVMGPHGEIAKRELQLVVSSTCDFKIDLNENCFIILNFLKVQ